MINFNETIIRNFIFHHYSSDLSSVFVNNEEYKYQNDNEEKILKNIFIKPFHTKLGAYEFNHSINLDYNPLYKLSQKLYEGNNFTEESINIFKHLQNVSKHPNIKDGDVFILKLDDIILDDKYYEGIAIYKVENKESYIQTFKTGQNRLAIEFNEGIGSKKIDKACLIIFTKRPYSVFIIDNNNKETEYWKNDFIRVRSKDDNINNTDNFMTLTRSFIESKLAHQNSLSKIDSGNLLSESLNYFKENNSFDFDNFVEKIFNDERVINDFKIFKNSFEEKNNFIINDSFDIVPQVVNKQNKKFKSLIKLDKNFDILIHNNTDLIEKGVDSNGRKYYKIYYDEEI